MCSSDLLQQPARVDWEAQDNTVTLTVTTEDPTFNGVADVTLHYGFAVAEGYRLRGGLHSYLTCRAVTESELWAERDPDTAMMADFQIPTDRRTCQIPVTIADGVGTVRLEALPADAATVTVEAAEVEAEMGSQDRERLEGEFGDLFFALVNAARLYGIDPESALERTNKKFIRRFNYMEERAAAKGHTLHELPLAEMEALWQEAKKTE